MTIIDCIDLFLIIPAIAFGIAHAYIAYVFWPFLLGMAGTAFAVCIASVTKWFPSE